MPVFHLDIEAFVTTVARLDDPALGRRPLVIAPDKPRALVLAASPDAKNMGITKNMPLEYVTRHFQGISVAVPNYRLYGDANRYVLDIVHEMCPVVEPMTYGHIAMDMTGMTQLYGSLENAALKLCREVGRRARLPATVGIATNKLVSTIAAKEIQKNQESLYRVAQDEEPNFLAPLSSRALPEWQERGVRKMLFELNLRRINQIQALPRDLLSFALGDQGTRLHRHALGIDPRPVMPPLNTPCLKAEHRFLPDTNDDEVIVGALHRLVEDLCYRMRARSMSAARARIVLKYSDDVCRVRKFRFQASQHEETIYQPLLAGYQRLCDRRGRVRYLELTLEGLQCLRVQPSLFQENNERRLAPHLDKIRKRFGAAAVQYGKTLKAS